jgi:hypothetical protein
MSVILSEAKNPGIFSHCLSLQMRGFFAEFTLSGANGLRMTGGGVLLYE